VSPPARPRAKSTATFFCTPFISPACEPGGPGAAHRLQPSTVSVITSQLIEEGWVLPGTLGRLPRGRRPTFVTLNDRHVTLAIDLRPDNANLAVVDINGKLLRRDTIPTSSRRLHGR
jgi:hypothetical protein